MTLREYLLVLIEKIDSDGYISIPNFKFRLEDRNSNHLLNRNDILNTNSVYFYYNDDSDGWNLNDLLMNGNTIEQRILYFSKNGYIKTPQPTYTALLEYYPMIIRENKIEEFLL